MNRGPTGGGRRTGARSTEKEKGKGGGCLSQRSLAGHCPFAIACRPSALCSLLSALWRAPGPTAEGLPSNPRHPGRRPALCSLRTGGGGKCRDERRARSKRDAVVSREKELEREGARSRPAMRKRIARSASLSPGSSRGGKRVVVGCEQQCGSHGRGRPSLLLFQAEPTPSPLLCADRRSEMQDVQMSVTSAPPPPLVWGAPISPSATGLPLEAAAAQVQS